MANTLHPGDSVTPSSETVLTSSNGFFTLTLEPHGELLITLGNKYPIWSSRTRGMVIDKLVYQLDGNVVMCASNGRLLFETGTKGVGAGGRLVLGDHGNLRVFDKAGTSVWASGVTANLLMVTGPLTHFEYDAAAAQLSFPQPVNKCQKTLTNPTAQPQTQTIELDVSFTEKRTFSGAGIFPGVAVAVHAPMPALTAGHVKVGAETTVEAIWMVESTEALTEKATVPVSVPARSSVTVDLTVTQQSFTVPFTCLASHQFIVEPHPVLDIVDLRVPGTLTVQHGYSVDARVGRACALQTPGLSSASAASARA